MAEVKRGLILGRGFVRSFWMEDFWFGASESDFGNKSRVFEGEVGGVILTCLRGSLALGKTTGELRRAAPFRAVGGLGSLGHPTERQSAVVDLGIEELGEVAVIVEAVPVGGSVRRSV